MSQPYGRLGFIDVLTASAAGSIDVNSQITGINLDSNVVLKLRRDKYRRERCMATMPGIEWGLSDQAVYACLRA